MLNTKTWCWQCEIAIASKYIQMRVWKIGQYAASTEESKFFTSEHIRGGAAIPASKATSCSLKLSVSRDNYSVSFYNLMNEIMRDSQ